MKFINFLDRLVYFVMNKFRIISLIFLRVLNINLKNKEPIVFPKKIIKNGSTSVVIQKNIWFYWEGGGNQLLLMYVLKKFIN